MENSLFDLQREVSVLRIQLAATQRELEQERQLAAQLRDRVRELRQLLDSATQSTVFFPRF